MKRIAIVTATRAEYGLLIPLIRRVIEDDELDLDLIVTGGHLSEKQGMTVKDIIKDGFPRTHQIPILDEDNSPYGISVTMANAIKRFAKCFCDDRPDMVVILGDRTEMLGVASAAMNERIPIVHIHGGEVTEGAVDDCVRHAITKMSYLHFTSTEEYRKRVIRLGEAPDRVFNVGALGVENILNMPLMAEDDIRENIGIPYDMKYSIVTFHPVTLEDKTAANQAEELCSAMASFSNVYWIITGANTDADGDAVNQILKDFSERHSNACFIQSLGALRYLSAVKYAYFVLGNSSSGILEAPALGIPAVNIGDRQKGRIMAETIINCEPDKADIEAAINRVKLCGHMKSGIYGNGHTSEKIVEIMKEFLKEEIVLKKGFYDGC